MHGGRGSVCPHLTPGSLQGDHLLSLQGTIILLKYLGSQAQVLIFMVDKTTAMKTGGAPGDRIQPFGLRARCSAVEANAPEKCAAVLPVKLRQP